MNPKLSAVLVVLAMAVAALLYQDDWPVWPSQLFLGIGFLVMAGGLFMKNRAAAPRGRSR